MNKVFQRKLVKLDATGLPMGRLASKIATLLRGKDEPEFMPHLDRGAIVEVSNLEKLVLTGKKMEQKEYYSFSGYPGGLKTRKMADVFIKNPGDVLVRAVREMLPDNRLRNGMMKRLILK